jgi:hypothetical protein
MLKRFLAPLALSLVLTTPASPFDLRRSTTPGALPPATGPSRLGDAEVSINAADKRLIFRNLDGTLGFGSLLNAGAAGRKAVESGAADDLTIGGTTSAQIAAQTFGLPYTFETIPSVVIPLTAFKGPSGTPWVRGTSTGPNAVKDAANTWWNVDVAQSPVRAEWFQRVADSGDWGLAAQRAVAALKATPTGGILAFAGKTYLFASTVNVPKAGPPLRITGEGRTTKLGPKVGNFTPQFAVGDTTAGGIEFVVDNLSFVGQNKTNSRAFSLKQANGAVFKNLWFDYQYVAIEAEDSHAVTIQDVTLLQIGKQLYHSSTESNALHISGVKGANVGYDNSNAPIGGLVQIEGPAYNLVIERSDVEVFTYLFKGVDVFSPKFSGIYTEQHSQAPIQATGALYSASIDSNLFSLPVGGFVWTLSNCVGGTFARNTMNDAKVAFGPSCIDMAVVDNKVLGAGSVGPAPWQPVTLQNGFVEQSSYGAVGFRKVNGRVELRGNFAGQATLPAVAFTLPVGYRPKDLAPFLAPGTSGQVRGRIAQDGQVTILTATGGEAGVTGVSFEPAP